MSLSLQIVTLFVLAIPIACVSWTVTHEDIFREPREWLVRKSETARHFWQRKIFYAFTCEYCFSHYVTMAMLAITQVTMLYTDWRGYVISGFSLVWIANVYMSLFGRLRLDIAHEKEEIKTTKAELRRVDRRAER